MISGTYVRIEGTSIIIRSKPIVGIIALTGFIDVTEGIDEPDYTFTKYFRYTTNGIDYSDWQLLTLPALTALDFTPQQLVVFEVSYNKHEPLGENQLAATSYSIDTTDAISTFITSAFDRSLFKEYFDAYNVEVLDWTVNVLEKIYNKGLIPAYINRQNSEGSNEDFIAFWRAVIQFFAFYVRYARVYERFYEVPLLIEEFITQRGLTGSIVESELDDLLYTFAQQVARRGTMHIIDNMSDQDPVNKPDDVQGELLRLVSFIKDEDEFLFNLYRYQDFGWTLDRSSPLYRGLFNNLNLNKMWEKDLYPTDIDKWHVENTTLLTDSSIGGQVFHMSDEGVIGNNEASKITIDSRLDYEFSFLIRPTSGTKLTVSFTAYDSAGVEVSLIPHNTAALTSNIALNAIQLNSSSRYQLVRVALYNNQKPKDLTAVTQTHQGIDLIIPQQVKAIIPSIQIEGEADVYGIRLLPLLTFYSRGFIQASNAISVWFDNREQRYTEEQIAEYVRKYLLPYNTRLLTSPIGKYLYTSVGELVNFTYWQGANPYCQQVMWIGQDPSCELKEFDWIPDETTAYCEQTL